MRVGILTYHRSINYGAFVQAYALQQLLSQHLGTQVEIIDYDSERSNQYYKRYLDKKYKKNIFKKIYVHKKRSQEEIDFAKVQRKAFQKAAQDHMTLSKEMLISDDLEEFRRFIGNKYDLIIVGSDEVWRVNGMRGFPNPYWLPDIKGCKKISFAASSRDNIDSLTIDQRSKIKEYLESFSYLSVRDQYTKNLLEEITQGRRVVLMCDPTMAYNFTIDREKGKALLKERFGINPDYPVIGVMDEFGKISQYVINRYKENIQIVSLYKYTKLINNCGNVNPLEWIHIISALDGLLTSFFHGMCIAINANTPFKLFEYRNVNDLMQSKSYDLLSRYNRSDLYCQMKIGSKYKKEIDAFIQKILNGSAQEEFSNIKKGEQKHLDSFLQYLSSIDSGI